MNKSQLVDALADRLGDRRTAATAVDALLQIVIDTVRSGESVSLTGFGVFESRARAARTGRNPRTGETVEVPATTVPAFRPGTGFRSAVADPADAAAPAAVPTAAAPPGRAATNGAGGHAAGAAVHGAVALSAPPAADAARPDAAVATKTRKKPKATTAPSTKDVKDDKDAKGKKEKKGKKHKK